MAPLIEEKTSTPDDVKCKAAAVEQFKPCSAWRIAEGDYRNENIAEISRIYLPKAVAI